MAAQASFAASQGLLRRGVPHPPGVNPPVKKENSPMATDVIMPALGMALSKRAGAGRAGGQVEGDTVSAGDVIAEITRPTGDGGSRQARASGVLTGFAGP